MALAAVLLLPRLGFLGLSNLLGTEADGRDKQIVQAITKEEQVALLSLGIQGIADENASTTLPLLGGAVIPWSERAAFVQYSFTAKLGIEGKDVAIEKTGEKAFRIFIPDFIFIGHDDADFKLATEENGALSWLTPEIDQLEMANNILNGDAQQQYVDQHRDLLEDQAEGFYRGIITGIEPAAEVEFEFGQ